MRKMRKIKTTDRGAQNEALEVEIKRPRSPGEGQRASAVMRKILASMTAKMYRQGREQFVQNIVCGKFKPHGDRCRS